jgi:hypothetical protein
VKYAQPHGRRPQLPVIVARLSVFAEEEKKDNARANNLEENLKEI